MTKEQILRSFLEDELFIEKGYLKPDEAKDYKWADPRRNGLIEVLRISIDGVMGGESENVTVKKVNQLLNTNT